MLLQNLLVGPAVRPIELGNDVAAVRQADLIDPVLVTVQRQETPADLEADFLDSRENAFRFELLVRERGVRVVRHRSPSVGGRPERPVAANTSMPDLARL